MYQLDPKFYLQKSQIYCAITQSNKKSPPPPLCMFEVWFVCRFQWFTSQTFVIQPPLVVGGGGIFKKYIITLKKTKPLVEIIIVCFELNPENWCACTDYKLLIN